MLRMAATKVYLAPGNTDMRAGIDRLSVTVQGVLDLDPFSGHLFVFCNRRRDAIKVLYQGNRMKIFFPANVACYKREQKRFEIATC